VLPDGWVAAAEAAAGGPLPTHLAFARTALRHVGWRRCRLVVPTAQLTVRTATALQMDHAQQWQRHAQFSQLATELSQEPAPREAEAAASVSAMQRTLPSARGRTSSGTAHWRRRWSLQCSRNSRRDGSDSSSQWVVRSRQRQRRLPSCGRLTSGWRGRSRECLAASGGCASVWCTCLIPHAARHMPGRGLWAMRALAGGWWRCSGPSCSTSASWAWPQRRGAACGGGAFCQVL
jgi:hypothetical protein